MAFKTPKAEVKPTLACVGNIDLANIGELKAGKNGSPYYSIPLQIKGHGKSMDTKINLSFLPDFFAADFDPDTIGSVYGKARKNSVEWSYKRNFVNSDATAMLQCIVGDQENFERFGAMVDGLPDLNPETIYDSLVGFLQDLGPVAFGYILGNGRKKTDDLDENGKNIYVPTGFYEVDAFWRITADNVKKIVKRAESNARKREDDPEAPKFLLRFEAEEMTEAAAA